MTTTPVINISAAGTLLRSRGEIMVAADERRRFRRYDLSLPLSVRRIIPHERHRKPGVVTQTTNISRGGMSFRCPGFWNIGNRIDLVVDVPFSAFGGRPTSIHCKGKIVRLDSVSDEACTVAAVIESVKLVAPHRRQA